MKSILTQYSDEILRTWRTSRLGCLYLNNFITATFNSSEISQLERIVTILRARPLPEVLEVYHIIGRHLEASRGSNDSEHTAYLKGAKEYFYRNVLD